LYFQIRHVLQFKGEIKTKLDYKTIKKVFYSDLFQLHSLADVLIHKSISEPHTHTHTHTHTYGSKRMAYVFETKKAC